MLICRFGRGFGCSWQVYRVVDIFAVVFVVVFFVIVVVIVVVEL